MINEDNLIKNLQNGLTPELKLMMLHEYRNYYRAEGFSLGFQDHLNTSKISKMKLRQAIEKRKNELLDRLRDYIWKRKIEIDALNE